MLFGILAECPSWPCRRHLLACGFERWIADCGRITRYSETARWAGLPSEWLPIFADIAACSLARPQRQLQRRSLEQVLTTPRSRPIAGPATRCVCSSKAGVALRYLVKWGLMRWRRRSLQRRTVAPPRAPGHPGSPGDPTARVPEPGLVQASPNDPCT